MTAINSTDAALLLAEMEKEKASISRPIMDKSNPFDEYNEEDFIKKYRVSKELATYLIETLKDELESERIPPSIRVLIALGFFANGGIQNSVSNTMKVSQSTVSRSVDAVTKAINKVLLPQFVKFPSLTEQHVIKRRFFEKFGIPGTIGAIDAFHVSISKPVENNNKSRDVAYMNRRFLYSLNVQLVVDDQHMIRSISARYPGSVDETFIWRHSDLRSHIEDMHTRHNTSAWLLGDDGYPLEPWLLTPFVNPNPGSVEESFNRKHAAARNCVERCNALLKARFKCLLKVLHYTPTKSALIINACAMLHNLCTKYRLDFDEDYEEPIKPDLSSAHTTSESYDRTLLSAALCIRDQIASKMPNEFESHNTSLSTLSNIASEFFMTME